MSSGASFAHLGPTESVPNLFDRRLLIITGKGGTGKSTVAAAAAVAAARRGKRVLIVEIGDQERIPSIFGSPDAGYAGARVYTGRTPGSGPIWSMCLTAREALKEFAVRSMKFEVLYGAVFEEPDHALLYGGGPRSR